MGDGDNRSQWSPGHRPVLVVGRRRVSMVGDVMVIGRADRGARTAPDLDLTDDDPGRLVSRRHAELRLDPTGLWLADLGSGNGTVVDDRAVRRSERHRVLPGSKIIVGDVVIVVDAEPVPGAPSPAPARRHGVDGAGSQASQVSQPSQALGEPEAPGVSEAPQVPEAPGVSEGDGDRLPPGPRPDPEPVGRDGVGGTGQLDEPDVPDEWNVARVDPGERRPRDMRETTYAGDEWGQHTEPADEPHPRAGSPLSRVFRRRSSKEPH